jgi:hypothetical protein
MFSFVNMQLLLDFFYLFLNINLKSAYIQYNNISQKTYNLYHFLKTPIPFRFIIIFSNYHKSISFPLFVRIMVIFLSKLE